MVCKVEISIDLGTVNSSAVWNHASRVERQPKAADKNVLFDGNKEIPTQLAYHQDQWLVGHEVDEALRGRRIDESDRIHEIKLVIDESEHTQTARDRISEQRRRLPLQAFRNLDPNSNDSLSIIFLSMFIDKAQESIFNTLKVSKGISGAHEVDFNPLFYLNPAAWSALQESRVERVVQQSMLDRRSLHLKFESECAAMYIEQKESFEETTSTQLFDNTQDHYIMVIDIGGGTVVRLRDPACRCGLWANVTISGSSMLQSSRWHLPSSHRQHRYVLDHGFLAGSDEIESRWRPWLWTI